MTDPNDTTLAALMALAVKTQLTWETAEERAEETRRNRERAWSAALASGRTQGEDLTWSLWRAVERARGARVEAFPKADRVQALVEKAAAAYLTHADARERETLAAGRLSTAWTEAVTAMPPGMTHGQLQLRYEETREKLRQSRVSCS